MERRALRELIAKLIDPVAFVRKESGQRLLARSWDRTRALNRANSILNAIEAEGYLVMRAGTGVQRIAAERRRQTEVEGWTPEHDDKHNDESLAIAGACYAMPPTVRQMEERADLCAEGGMLTVPKHWPWAAGWWKPKNRMRGLERAGALIAAELDRLDRREAHHRSAA